MKHLYLLLFTLLYGLSAIAQPHSPDKNKEDFEHYKALKVSYITSQLELTPEEAQGFWPIYNEYEKARFINHDQCKKLEQDAYDNYNKYTDEQFNKLNQQIVDLYVKRSQILKDYNTKFLNVLPTKKVAILNKVENDFRFKMIQEYRKREVQRQHGPDDANHPDDN